MPSRSPTDDVDPADPDPGGSVDGAWTPDDVPSVDGLETGPASIPPLVGEGAPSVVAVVVTKDPDDALDEVLEGLVSQEYANLSVLVIDAGSTVDPTVQIAGTAPSAFVKRVGRTSGFAAAANGVFGVIEGATFFLFLHDDAQLAPAAVQSMVAEAFHANAGIVGAKLVDWDDPKVLRSVGSGSDRFGFRLPISEPGELDQSQHDAPGDVAAVSHAALLVRADLFTDLGGFSEDLIGDGVDLDLCWRARIVGARTAIMPAAVARHRGRSAIGDDDSHRRRLALRNSGRMVLANYSLPHLARVLPQAMLASVLEVVVALFSGRFAQVGDIASAWAWNLLHLPTTLARRRSVAASRRVPDSKVRAVQSRGSARINAYLRGARSASDGRVPAALAATRGRSWQETASPIGLVIGVAVAVVVVFGGRHLIGDGIPVIREFAGFRTAGSMASEWWNGWRVTGVGAPVSAPASLLAAAGSTVLAFGHAGLARTSSVLLLVPIGVWGAWRMLAGVAADRSRAAIAATYLAAPVAYDAIAEGRLGVLAVYATLPWVLGRLLRAGEDEPFEGVAVTAEVAAIRCGLVVALGAVAAPVVVLVAGSVAVVVALVAVASGRGRAARRVALTGVGAVATVALVHLPQTVGLLTGSQRWALLTRTGGSSRRVPSLWDLVHLGGSSSRGAFLAAGFVIAALFPLLVGIGWRFRMAVVAWGLILLGWSIGTFTAHTGRSLGIDIEEALVLSVVGVSLGVGLAVEAFAADVRRGSFGFRQLSSVVAAVAACIGVLPLALVAWNGRFNAPTSDVPTALQTLDTGRGATQFRTLWIGDRDTLPLTGWPLRGDVVAATTEGTAPDLSTAAPPAAGSGEEQVLAALGVALDGGSRRLGELLAPAGIRYIVVMGDGNVTGTSNTGRPSGPVADMLASQLDLVSVDVSPGVGLYGNPSALPLRASTDASTSSLASGSLRSLLDTPLPATTPALSRGTRSTDVAGTVGPGTLLVAMSNDEGWKLTIDGKKRTPEKSFGWAQRYDAGSTKTDRARLSYSPSAGRISLGIVQLVIVLALIVVVVARRRRRKDMA